MKSLIAVVALTMSTIGAAHAGNSAGLHQMDAVVSQSAQGCILGRGSAASVEDCAASALSHSNSTHR
jgi:hypothetical protein